MNERDLVVYKNVLYEITSIDSLSSANRFKLEPVASFNSDELTTLFAGSIYLPSHEQLELFVGQPPKYRLGQRVVYKSDYYSVRLILVRDKKYWYQIDGEEKWRSLIWVKEDELY